MMIKALVILCALTAACDAGPTSSDTFLSQAPRSTEALSKTNEPCETVGSIQGVCVPYYKCPQKFNTGLIDFRIVEEVCESFIDVCCTASDEIEPSTESTATKKTV